MRSRMAPAASTRSMSRCAMASTIRAGRWSGRSRWACACLRARSRICASTTARNAAAPLRSSPARATPELASISDSMAHDAHAIAEAVKLGMFMDDAASRGLGMHIEAIGPGYSRIAMTVRPDMLNGFKICHGGFVTTLADPAFAFACNSYNEVTVADGIVVDFLAPAHE